MITMMSQKKKHFFLHELLSEDQEPFQLNSYISEKQSQIKKHNNNNNCSTLQLKKQKPIQHHSSSSLTFSPIKACFNATTTTTTQDITKSPLFKLSQQHNNYNSKSPCGGSPNPTIFLHVPARTASILLEAALRIQKHSKTKTHYHKNNNGNTFGLFGSLFKRLAQRSRKKKKNKQIECQKESNNNNVKKVKDILRFELDSCSAGRRRTEEEENNNNTQCYGACFVDDDDDGYGFFCESPFRFVLQRSLSSSSSGRRTPEFSSPAASPIRCRAEDKVSNNREDSINKFQTRVDEEEEEKEQCSPVSVLDPPFEDDDDVHENDYEEGGFDLDSSYANVQRTKQQLLYRLCRFEKLAELDPLELEKRMVDEDGTCIEEEGCEDDNNRETCYEENKGLRELVHAILCQSSIYDRKEVSEDLKRIVSDLIIEEEIRDFNSSADEDIVTRVCKRLELWKEVDSNTIDMMIDEDFSREEGGWKKKSSQQVTEMAGELELAIFSSLVDEFSEELTC